MSDQNQSDPPVSPPPPPPPADRTDEGWFDILRKGDDPPIVIQIPEGWTTRIMPPEGTETK